MKINTLIDIAKQINKRIIIIIVAFNLYKD